MFLLEKGPLESSSSYYKRLEADIMAIVIVGTEVDSVNYRGGKQSGGSIFPAVMALVYIGVWLVHSLYISRPLSLRDSIELK